MSRGNYGNILGKKNRKSRKSKQTKARHAGKAEKQKAGTAEEQESKKTIYDMKYTSYQTENKIGSPPWSNDCIHTADIEWHIVPEIAFSSSSSGKSDRAT